MNEDKSRKELLEEPDPFLVFVGQMMDLTVNISLEDALDRGWEILAECFTPEETGLRSELINEYWPKNEK